MSKVILITGGSSGIGKSIGEYLKDNGYDIYGTSRNPDRYADTKIKLVQLDVSNQLSIENAVSKVIEDAGRIDVLINNAGAGITGPVEETPQEEILRNFNTNFFGPINVIKAVLPQMRDQNSGLIINITSIAGYMGLPYRGIYSASKGALELITEAFRMEIKDFNIQMTNVAPVISGSPYEKSYGSVLRSIDEHVDEGDDPILVSKMILKIIKTPNPKIHYKVGAFMQKFSVVLKRILPDKLYEKLLLNHYGLK